MYRTMLKSKIHKAVVSQADLNYEGSISMDPELIQAGELWPFEKVDIYNITNGQRFSTYVIEGQPNEICLNGAAARLAQIGDEIIIASYIMIEEKELSHYQPKIVLMGKHNQIQTKKK